jgi:uroporphyrinogen-III synthase
MKKSRFPLAGKVILVTRSRKQASVLVARISELGGTVIEFPVIEVVPPQNEKPMDDAIRDLTRFDWILFTSANGVEFFFKRASELGEDLSDWSPFIGVVGPKTAEAIRLYGKEPHLIAKDFKAEGLLLDLKARLTGEEQILFPRSSMARPILAQELTHFGLQVTEVDAYDTVMPMEKAPGVLADLQKGCIDFITFTSSSTVKNFCGALGQEMLHQLPAKTQITCIGPVTAETALTHQLRVDAVAKEHTIQGLIEALLNLVYSEEQEE